MSAGISNAIPTLRVGATIHATKDTSWCGCRGRATARNCLGLAGLLACWAVAQGARLAPQRPDGAQKEAPSSAGVPELMANSRDSRPALAPSGPASVPLPDQLFAQRAEPASSQTPSARPFVPASAPMLLPTGLGASSAPQVATWAVSPTEASQGLAAKRAVAPAGQAALFAQLPPLIQEAGPRTSSNIPAATPQTEPGAAASANAAMAQMPMPWAGQPSSSPSTGAAVLQVWMGPQGSARPATAVQAPAMLAGEQLQTAAAPIGSGPEAGTEAASPIAELISLFSPGTAAQLAPELYHLQALNGGADGPAMEDPTGTAVAPAASPGAQDPEAADSDHDDSPEVLALGPPTIEGLDGSSMGPLYVQLQNAAELAAEQLPSDADLRGVHLDDARFAQILQANAVPLQGLAACGEAGYKWGNPSAGCVEFCPGVPGQGMRMCCDSMDGVCLQPPSLQFPLGLCYECSGQCAPPA